MLRPHAFTDDRTDKSKLRLLLAFGLLGIGIGSGRIIVLDGLLELADAAAERTTDTGEPTSAEDRNHNHENNQ